MEKYIILSLLIQEFIFFSNQFCLVQKASSLSYQFFFCNLNFFISIVILKQHYFILNGFLKKPLENTGGIFLINKENPWVTICLITFIQHTKLIYILLEQKTEMETVLLVPEGIYFFLPSEESRHTGEKKKIIPQILHNTAFTFSFITLLLCQIRENRIYIQIPGVSILSKISKFVCL